MLALLSALGVRGFSGSLHDDHCDGPLDCNGKNCLDCSCTDHQCQCADGWSGPHCEMPFCNATSGCSGHGSCVMKAKSISCTCDAGWAGPHCETAVCALVCVHGGTPDAGCTTCEGCRGAWGGKLCDAWNASFPASSVQLQLSALKNASQAALQASLKYNPICRQGQECVGWGVDLGSGKAVNYPQLTLNFTGSTPSWNGLKYPLGTSVVPNQAPGFAIDGPRALPTEADHFNYVEGLWSSQQGRAGWYSQGEASVTAIYDDPTDWYPSVTQAIYELYQMTIDPDPTSKSGYAPRMDASALAALQTVGPTYEQDPIGWDTFFQNWGTSVVLESHSGGMLEFVSYASTVIPLVVLAGKDNAIAQMQAQAGIVLTNATGLGGHSGTLDLFFGKHSFPGNQRYAVFGGDPTKAPITEQNRSAWFESLKAEQVLTSFKLAPLSVFVESATLAKALEDATHAYLAQQRAQWANVTHCPPTCNGHGNCSSSQQACTCEWPNQGRQCSVTRHYYDDPAYGCAPDEEVIEVASAFDKVAIVCYMEACEHQVERWPVAMQSRIQLVRSHLTNDRLGLNLLNLSKSAMHAHKVTQGHADAWDLLNSSNSVLVLEEDFEPVEAEATAFANDKERDAHFRRFVQRNTDWRMLRFGYNLANTNFVRADKVIDGCPIACRCTRTVEDPNVCLVAQRERTDDSCDVRSFVAYAVHRRMYPTLRAYARAALRNMSACPGCAGGYTTMPIDLWFPTTDDMHYYTPGIAVQGGRKKEEHQRTMRIFAKNCVQ